jgi:hypothetical protein
MHGRARLLLTFAFALVCGVAAGKSTTPSPRARMIASYRTMDALAARFTRLQQHLRATKGEVFLGFVDGKPAFPKVGGTLLLSFRGNGFHLRESDWATGDGHYVSLMLRDKPMRKGYLLRRAEFAAWDAAAAQKILEDAERDALAQPPRDDRFHQSAKDYWGQQGLAAYYYFHDRRP